MECHNLYHMQRLLLIKNVSLEEILNTKNNSENGYALKVDLKYTKHAKDKSWNFPFHSENKKYHFGKTLISCKITNLNVNILEKKPICEHSN